MKVKEAMNKNVKTVRPDSTVKDATKSMVDNGVGSLIVLSGAGMVTGIITERDVLTDIVIKGMDSAKVKVEDVMTKKLVTVSPESSLEDAADLMTKHKIKKLPVVDQNGSLIGIITATDLIRYEKELIEKVAELISVSPFKGISG